MRIETTGLRKLPQELRDELTSTTERLQTRLQRHLAPDVALRVRYKVDHPEGSRQRYTVHAALAHGKSILATKHEDWNATIALRKALGRIEARIDEGWVGAAPRREAQT